MRVIFVRHAESMWNLVFNRGFKPSFLWRLISALVYGARAHQCTSSTLQPTFIPLQHDFLQATGAPNALICLAPTQ